ncbi:MULTISPECIES: hypothetical protein [Blastomonas]|uniref:hypothetical protein n=1 Tax=Blastomonas TaxID=150203 RepID=UPI0025A38D2A|nr:MULTISPECIES: hypothetical protein [Blastomonas]MDM7957165.1 hypothetical protein [Blastomonas sp.]MDM7966787.1 hypothetical protein [Blastomonas fulva]
MKRLAVSACLGACLMLAGCSETRAGDDEAAVTPLDAAAIEAGVIADPLVLDLAGSFADAGGTGSDSFCARGNRDQGYAVGVLVTFGGSSQCEGQGRAVLTGEQARISLTRSATGASVDDCSFSARFDGSALALAGSVPAGCQAVCSNRASLAGASFALVENGDRAALAARGRDINRLCGD